MQLDFPLAQSARDMRQLVEHVPAAVFRLAHDGDGWRTQFATKNVSMFGYDVADFVSGKMSWSDIVHPDDWVMINKLVQDYESHGVNEYRLYYRVVCSNGDAMPITEVNTVNKDAGGKVLYYDTVILNNTTSVASQTMEDNHLRQQMVLNDILMSLHASDLDHALQIILDRSGEYLDSSRALLFKDSPDHKTCKVVYEWDNNDITSVMDLDYSITYETGMPEIYIALQTTGSLLINYGEIPENCKEEFEAEGLVASAIFAVYLGGEHYGFVCFDDCVVERKWDADTVRFLKNISNLISTVVARQHAARQLEDSQATIQRMAYSDPLTGLYNRHSLDAHLTAAIEDARQSGGHGYLVFIDLDDFKIVNDCYGHDYGDDILRTFAAWLQSTYPAPCEKYRFGGDEFVLLIPAGAGVDIEALLEQLHQRADQPWKSQDREFYCTLSAGVVRFPMQGHSSTTVIKQADIAMYEAKRLGKNRHKIYEDVLDTTTQRRTEMEALLRRSMKNGFEGFEILYQPIVNAAGGAIVGAEALLRIRDGDAVVMPQDFLPLAEYLGFIVPIGEHVLAAAAAECRKINEGGLPNFKITVNISARQMQQKDILPRLEEILADSGVNTANMVFSVSESVVLDDPARMQAICGRLGQLGITVTLDDFGGGSASFLQLHQLPVELITTSTTLIYNLEDGYSKEFLGLIIRLCHAMGKQVCINGIETKHQYDYCLTSGADCLQGFYLYTAKNADILKSLL